jgi:uncharacterized coiled-coil DUF342 family protein
MADVTVFCRHGMDQRHPCTECEEIAALAAEREKLIEEIEAQQSQRDKFRHERDELQSKLARYRAELERLMDLVGEIDRGLIEDVLNRS